MQKIFAYSVTAKLFQISFFFNENHNLIFYELFLRTAAYSMTFEFFLNNFFDIFFNSLSFCFDLNEDNFRKTIGLLDPTLCAIYYPESIFLNKANNTYLFLETSANIKLIVCDFLEKNCFFEPINFFLQLFFIVFFVVFFIIFFFSSFSKNKEDWQLDCDYVISNASVEAEKELFSIDDALSTILFLILVFGSYFGFLFLGWSLSFSEISIFIIPVLFIFYLIILIPINLLFDFGLFFVCYLRGSSNTSSFFFECVYDYIGVIAFFTRLVVQFVRLILMFVVYCLMHDTVMLQVFSQKNFLIGDSFWDELMSISSTGASISFFLFVAFPLRLMYWIYECLHTFFVVTVQFSAFFTIVFWLFLLFYTFFVYEKYEHHFDNLNKMHKKLIDELKSLKK